MLTNSSFCVCEEKEGVGYTKCLSDISHVLTTRQQGEVAPRQISTHPSYSQNVCVIAPISSYHKVQFPLYLQSSALYDEIILFAIRRAMVNKVVNMVQSKTVARMTE